MTAGTERYESLLEEIRQEFPGFRMVRKQQSASQRAIDWALKAVTAGRMRSYMTAYQTTIGETVYVTADWDGRPADDRYITMRHERMHLRQFDIYGLPVMAVLYLLLPMPMGLAWFRAHFEREAYEETIRAAAAVHGVEHVRDTAFRDRIIDQFTGPSYGWMWPFRRSLEQWYAGVLEEVAG